VALARAVSATFSGIRPADAPAFIGAQIIGAIAATFLFPWLVPSLPKTAEEILMPYGSQQVKTYLFACVHNAGRSQMAAALFNIYADQSQCWGISAGTQPANHVHPEVGTACTNHIYGIGSLYANASNGSLMDPQLQTVSGNSAVTPSAANRDFEAGS
jgi:glycerol uptake facilitator-like aquaporin